MPVAILIGFGCQWFLHAWRVELTIGLLVIVTDVNIAAHFPTFWGLHVLLFTKLFTTIHDYIVVQSCIGNEAILAAASTPISAEKV
jgi:hypothetical protein